MKSYLIIAWNMIDPLYYHLSNLTCIHNGKAEKNFLRVKLTRYKGRMVVLSDGTQINKNDTLVKIHLHNAVLLKELGQMKSNLYRGRFIFQAVRKSLPDLVSYIQKHHQVDQIKGIIGITSLDKGVNRLGFEVVPIANPLYKWFKWASFLPICILSGTDVSIKKQSGPSYLFMSKVCLISRYKVQ